jgi:hypothetical protein
MTGQPGDAPIDGSDSSIHFTFTFLDLRNVSDVKESESEIPHLATPSNETISPLNDIFGSKKMNLFSFQGQLVLFRYRMSLSCILNTNHSLVSFIFIRYINTMHS